MDDEALDLPTGVGRLKILVVDDYRDSADALALILTQFGENVMTAYDGRSALEIASTFSPDVIFLDLGLPDISGFEVATNLKARTGEVKPLLVAVSAWGDVGVRKRTREAGFDFHLQKPNATAEIVSAFSKRKNINAI